MLHELLEVFEEVDREDSIHALIISGSGKAFCAGADSVSYTHLPSPRDRTRSRMPSSA